VLEVMRAWGELDDYVDNMVARCRHTLTEDLLSDLIRAEHDGDRLNTEELRMLAAALTEPSPTPAIPRGTRAPTSVGFVASAG
jgi:hypothetical protein